MQMRAEAAAAGSNGGSDRGEVRDHESPVVSERATWVQGLGTKAQRYHEPSLFPARVRPLVSPLSCIHVQAVLCALRPSLPPCACVAAQLEVKRRYMWTFVFVPAPARAS